MIRICPLVDRLPKVLKREPLIDAIFEIRFAGSPNLADILPGLLFGQLEPKPKLHRQPAHDIPQPLRANDPNLAFLPVLRLELERFTISIGDRNVVVGCKLPYPKWPTFKKKILELTSLMAKVGLAGDVERFSVKYVNVISAPTLSEQIAKVAVAMRVGSIEVVNNHFQLQVHHHEQERLHIISVITGAEGRLPTGETIIGVVIDIDSIKNILLKPFEEFVSGFEPELESLRQANKVKFFECLKPKTIEELEPTYE